VGRISLSSPHLPHNYYMRKNHELLATVEGDVESLGGRCTRVANANARGEDGWSTTSPPRVRNEPDEPVTPRETWAGKSMARGSFARVWSPAEAVTAESTRQRANSRTARASTADDASDIEKASDELTRLDRRSISVPSNIVVMAVLLGHRTPTPEMEALRDSGKQRNLSGAIINRTANIKLGSVEARISRMGQRKDPLFSSEVDLTGPFGQLWD